MNMKSHIVELRFLRYMELHTRTAAVCLPLHQLWISCYKYFNEPVLFAKRSKTIQQCL